MRVGKSAEGADLICHWMMLVAGAGKLSRRVNIHVYYAINVRAV